jgi:hypothetical protein
MNKVNEANSYLSKLLINHVIKECQTSGATAGQVPENPISFSEPIYQSNIKSNNKFAKAGKYRESVRRHMKESGNGWSSVMEEVSSLERVLNDISELQYELKNCVRGAYSDCSTTKELSIYVKRLAQKLDEAGDDIASVQDDDDYID